MSFSFNATKTHRAIHDKLVFPERLQLGGRGRSREEILRLDEEEEVVEEKPNEIATSTNLEKRVMSFVHSGKTSYMYMYVRVLMRFFLPLPSTKNLLMANIKSFIGAI